MTGGTGGSGGAGGGGTGNSGGSTGTGGGTSTGGGAAPPDDTVWRLATGGGGCSCEVGPQGSDGGRWLALMALGLGLVVRRRRGERASERRAP